LKYTAFTAIDQFGKGMILEAALNRYEQLATTSAGVKKIREKYGRSLGEEFPQLVADLQRKNKSDLVQSVLFAELSDLQPITRMEVPQMYLDMPNGRAIFMLKTFMLKQGDIIRRDAYNEIKKGEIATGFGNLFKYAVLLGISGATIDTVKDWMMGRDISAKWDRIYKNMLKTFGWSDYVADKVKRGDMTGAAESVILPPYRIMDDIIKADPKAIQYIFVIGKIIYSRLFGGAERSDAWEAWNRDVQSNIPREALFLQKQLDRERESLYNMYQKGDMKGFDRGLWELQQRRQLSDKQVEAIRRNAAIPPVYRKFKALPEPQQEAALKGMAPDIRRKYLPYARKSLQERTWK
jgi:hypothetical protein